MMSCEMCQIWASARSGVVSYKGVTVIPECGTRSERDAWQELQDQGLDDDLN